MLNSSSSKVVGLIVVWSLFAITLPAQILSDQQAVQRALALLKAYDSAGYKVVQAVNSTKKQMRYDFGFCGPGEYVIITTDNAVLTYLSQRTEKGIVEDLPDVVHELTHGYVSNPYKYMQANNICPDKNYHIYPLANEEILVKLTPTFPSKELAVVIPEKYRTFRYATYIEGNTSTQSEGIYGLLDEWHAYYSGARTAFLLKAYYSKTIQKPEDWIDFFSGITGELTAYYEFKYFILKYLSYAAKKYPDVFKGIMENTEFRKMFVYVDFAYANLISDVKAFRDSLLSDLSKKGVKISKSNGDLFIGNTGTTLMEATQDILALEPALSEKELQDIWGWLKK
jgi:outer membrane lipoprotein-sorting protein